MCLEYNVTDSALANSLSFSSAHTFCFNCIVIFLFFLPSLFHLLLLSLSLSPCQIFHSILHVISLPLPFDYFPSLFSFSCLFSLSLLSLSSLFFLLTLIISSTSTLFFIFSSFTFFFSSSSSFLQFWHLSIVHELKQQQQQNLQDHHSKIITFPRATSLCKLFLAAFVQHWLLNLLTTTPL